MSRVLSFQLEFIAGRDVAALADRARNAVAALLAQPAAPAVAARLLLQAAGPRCSDPNRWVQHIPGTSDNHKQ